LRWTHNWVELATPLPITGVAAHGVIATPHIQEPPSSSKDADQRQPLTAWHPHVMRKHPIEVITPRPQHRQRLHFALIRESRCAGEQHLLDRAAGDLPIPGNLLDRRPVTKNSRRIRAIASTTSPPAPSPRGGSFAKAHQWGHSAPIHALALVGAKPT
jgi:hypothetical protein